MRHGLGPSLVRIEGRFDVAADGYGLLYQHELDRVAASVVPSAALLYCALVSLRNSKSRTTTPIGIGLLATKTNQTKRTIQRGLRSLLNAGLITQERHGQRCVYAFPLLENATSMTQKCDIHDVQNNNNRE